MSIETIPKSRWSEFLEGFSRVHRGWLMTVEAAEGVGVLMHDVPLASIIFERGDIVIEAAKDRQHTDHVVSKPVTLRVERTAEGADQQIEFADADGGVVRVRFRSAIRPELVDGVAGFGRP